MPRLTAEQIIDMRQKLDYYDVVQHGWEQEHNGFEANAKHVLAHLTKDLMSKNYVQEHQVRTEIAPDLLQHGLRLQRWAGIEPGALPVEWRDSRANTDKIKHHLGGLSTQVAILLEANAVLANNMHALDHQKDRPAAEASRYESIGRASGLLICSAEFQAELFNFDLCQAFDDRLAALRKRFKIPQPAQ